MIEDFIPFRSFQNWVFRCQGNATGADDDHDEQIEIAEVDHEMTESPNPREVRGQRVKKEKVKVEIFEVNCLLIFDITMWLCGIIVQVK